MIAGVWQGQKCFTTKVKKIRRSDYFPHPLYVIKDYFVKKKKKKNLVSFLGGKVII